MFVFRSLRFQFLEVSEKAKFCTNKFLANVWVWQNCQLQAIFREFYISCSFDPFVFVKDRISQFLNRLKIGAMRKIDLFWNSFNIGVVLEIFKTCFTLLAEESKMVKVRFIIFSICLVRRQEADKPHFSFFSKFLPFRLRSYIWW